MAKQKDIMLTANEWQILRNSLDIITIQGKDARMVADLQSKLDSMLAEIKATK